MMALNLSSPVTEISHIAKGVAAQLKHLGILKVEDLLFYFPARWDDLSHITPLREVKIGQRAVVRGRLELIESTRSRWRKKFITQAIVADQSGRARVVWFNQPWIAKMFKKGDELYLVGELKDDGSGVYFSSPGYERVSKGAATHVARIVPVYPSTEKLSQKQLRFLVKNVLPLARAVPDNLPVDIRQEYKLATLPEALSQVHFPANEIFLDKARRRLKFDELFRLQLFAVSLKRELKKIPAPKIEFKEAETKKFVDGLPFKLTDDQRKAAWEIISDLTGRRKLNNLKTEQLNNSRSVVQSFSRFVHPMIHPMNRLLEGDVGSGKTVVVAIAALNAVLGGCPLRSTGLPSASQWEKHGQVAIMVPTEILARQHFGTFTKFFASHNISVGLFTQGAITVANSQFLISNSQSNPNVPKKVMHKFISDGEVDIVIGTHALIQKDAHFKNLVLTVVDEQHRFGVSQRAALKEKRTDGLMPHLLTLTATPIPRSLALVFYGDLDISILRQMPTGRQKIETRIVTKSQTESDLVTLVRVEVANGRQVFWTCPIIDPSDTLGVKAATEVFEHLRAEVFPDLRVGLLHGRMKSKERERVMEEFVGIAPTPPSPPSGRGGSDRISPPFEGGARGGFAHMIDILVATPVIEVGIDVPNATVMVIEGAERFGLAQLHQFRGRVGRGQAQSYCLLMVDDAENVAQGFSPDQMVAAGLQPAHIAQPKELRLQSHRIRPEGLSYNKTLGRLKAFLESQDGFALAERDLELRGPGEVYSGTAQSGFPEFKIATFHDVEIAKQAKAAAEKLLNQDPELTQFPELKREVMAREGKAHLE